MKVGNWHVVDVNVSDVNGIIVIRGKVFEDGSEVEFHVDLETGNVSAYERLKDGRDLDWALSEDEISDVEDWVSGYLIALEVLSKNGVPEVLEYPAPNWTDYSMFGCDWDGGNYCTFVRPYKHVNPRAGDVEYYILSYSSRGVGPETCLVVGTDGHLYGVSEEYCDGLDVIDKFADLEVYGPFDEERFLVEWANEYQKWLQEWDAYEAWLKE